MRDEIAAPVRLADYAPADFHIHAFSLTFQLEPHATRVRAEAQIRRRGDHARPLVLDGARLKLLRAAIDATDLAPGAYTIEPERLIVPNTPNAFTLTTEVEIDPAGNTALEGLYVSGGRFCTQCEAEGFRKITYFIDRPDNLAVYQVRIEADAAQYPTLLSNGDLIDSGPLENGRHFALWRDPHPKPSYLFALVAGRFSALHDSFCTRSGRAVQLGIYVDPGDSERARYAMDALKRAMAWDEKAFDREYDLDIFNIVAVRDFNFGAMENKGLNIFNSAYVLADSDTATDADYEAIESIVGHEYFHNWTGNRITCRDWFQLSLKEGLTVFRDQEFSADQRSRPVQRIKDVKRLRARQFPEDAGPLAHPVRPASFVKIDNFYTATVYEKGAEVIRMLKALIGPDAFARGMAIFFKRCDGMAATVEDFIACFAEASGRNLAGFMAWYGQAGTPHLKAHGAYDATAQTFALTVAQSTLQTPGQIEKRPVPIPLKVGFISAGGAILAARVAGGEVAREEHDLVLDVSEKTWRFEGVAQIPIPALLRGFTAPVILDDGLGEAERLAQAAHDPDPFTRWEATQAVARATILAAQNNAPAKADALAAAFARTLDRAPSDPAFGALCLRLPDLAELIQISDHPDPEQLFKAREKVRTAIARALRQKLTEIARAPSPERFSPDAQSAGARALKAAALDLLAGLGGETSHILVGAFAEARSMAEQLPALEAMGANGAPQFDEALEIFHQRWRSNPLVLDKWFSLQAAAARPDALARVEALRRHPDYEPRNPNRVRALAMAFAQRNLAAFHAPDGGGYAFIARVADESDKINPALAARMLGVFESWRRFDDGRRGHMQRILTGLLADPQRSKNAREIIERTLS
jgi:aminopeptidase N